MTFIGLAHFKLRIPESFTLKDKRRVIKSLKDKISSRFNISIAEVGFQNEKRLSELAIAMVNSDQALIHRSIMQILAIIENDGRCEIMDFTLEWL